MSPEEAEVRLTDEIALCTRDPLRFVMIAFPWGSAELANHEGPDEWQRDVLTEIGQRLETGALLSEVIAIAIASGHGVGKSCLVSWLILWAISTMPDTRGVITANTESQLRTKTWAELSKWHRLCICRHWFTLSATAIYSVDPEHERTWRIDKIAWSEENAEAFAGLHNQGRRIFVAFDESSAIPDTIWETTEGALTDTDTEIIWAVFGNPTRNTGRFRECFGSLKHRWITKQVDSRTVKITNKKQIADWLADYGEDSDFVRIRVRGTFPRVGNMQFISTEVVEMAMRRREDEVSVTLMDPLLMGVDVARFGEDASVIKIRRGRDARTHRSIKLRGVDTMTLAARVVDEATRLGVDAIFVDGGGVGGGVVDRLRQLRMQNVYEVQFGGKPDRSTVQESGPIIYANKAAEIWGLMRDWLKYALLPEDKDLADELTSREFGYVMREGKDAIMLEKKEDMRRRGLASPDDADALALTFAFPVQPSRHAPPTGLVPKPVHQVEYSPLGAAWSPQGQNPYGQQPQRAPWMPHNPNGGR
jgi:hypothetical protein